jgi:hypothetical protein
VCLYFNTGEVGKKGGRHGEAARGQAVHHARDKCERQPWGGAVEA